MSPKYTNKLHDSRVLILGGTSGIGFSVAENALENGAIVTIASSRQSSVDDALSRLNTSYPDLRSRVSGHTIDLRSDDAESSILALLRDTTSEGKHPFDHIVFTAGDSLPIAPIDQFAGLTTLSDAMRIRLAAPMLLAKLAPNKYLTSSPRSSITLTGGVNTYQPTANWTLIATIGGATDGLMRGLAVDLRPIRVNVIAPGSIETELFGKSFGEDKERLAAVKKEWAGQTLVGLLGSPEDMSEAYLHAMRDGYLTGQIIVVEGGLLLAPGTKR